MLAGTLCGLFYAGLLTVFTLLVFFYSGSVSEPVACSGGGMHGCRAAAADDVSVCHVLAAGAVALFFCLRWWCLWDCLGSLRLLLPQCSCFYRTVIFSFAGLGLLLWGHICLPMCRWEMCGILSGNYLIPQYCMQPAEAGLWKMICACRLQEMNLPCYSAVERLRSA